MTSVLDTNTIYKSNSNSEESVFSKLISDLTNKNIDLTNLVVLDRECYTGLGINTHRKTPCGYRLKRYISLANKTIKRSTKLFIELKKKYQSMNFTISQDKKEEISKTISQIDYLHKKIQEEYDLEKDLVESRSNNTDTISQTITKIETLISELDTNYASLKGEIKCYTGTGFIHGFGFGNKTLKKCAANVRPSVLDAKKILSEKDKYSKIVKKVINHAKQLYSIDLEDTQSLRTSGYKQEDIFMNQIQIGIRLIKQE